MKIKQGLFVLALMACLAGAAFVAREAEGPGLRMVSAADQFLAGLSAEQKKQATFAFEDKERTRWWFTPQQSKDRKSTRKGLPLSEMNDKQKELARDLLRAGTSEAGFKKAATVMSLEAILDELEKGKGPVRNPGWYFFTVFGSPSKTGKWGWRVEGHHLSLNFTLDGGKVVTATPFFLGANPAEVKTGKHKGTVALPDSMNSFRTLVKSLDDGQRKTAYRDRVFKEIEENNLNPKVGEPVGISADKLKDKQKDALNALVDAYLSRMPSDVATHERAEIKKASPDTIYFAYGLGDGTPGKPYQYRVQGPTFLIEFINEQTDGSRNPANHIHSIYRKLKSDFGLAAR